MKSTLSLIHHTDQALKTVSEPFNFESPPFDPVEFSQELVKIMYDVDALSLTAIQVGIPYRIFVMRGQPQNFACFNPRIVQPSEQHIRLEETSPTYPGLVIKVKRPQHCRVRFTMPNGDTRTDTFTGMTARVFQHNMNFLNGELFWKDANPIHRDQSLRKWRLTTRKTG